MLHTIVNVFFYVLIFLFFINFILSFFSLPPSNPVVRFVSLAIRPVYEPFERRIPPAGIFNIAYLVAIWALYFINGMIQYALPARW